MQLAPVNDEVTIDDLTLDPYSFYHQARERTPIVTVKSLGRTLLTKLPTRNM